MLPYCLKRNGSVQPVGKELLRVARAVILELQLPPKNRPELLPIFKVQSKTCLPQADRIKQPLPFSLVAQPRRLSKRLLAHRPLRQSHLMKKAREAFQSLPRNRLYGELHSLVSMSLYRHRFSMRKNAWKGILQNFEGGDYMLVTREDFSSVEKLCLRWYSPRCMIKKIT